MTEYDNTNRGALFVNNKKEQAKHPDYTGSINIEGNEYWLSAWEKQSKAGATFLSISVSLKDSKPTTGFMGSAKQVSSTPPKPFGVDAPKANPEDFDDIPFS